MLIYVADGSGCHSGTCGTATRGHWRECRCSCIDVVWVIIPHSVFISMHTIHILNLNPLSPYPSFNTLKIFCKSLQDRFVTQCARYLFFWLLQDMFGSINGLSPHSQPLWRSDLFQLYESAVG